MSCFLHHFFQTSEWSMSSLAVVPSKSRSVILLTSQTVVENHPHHLSTCHADSVTPDVEVMHIPDPLASANFPMHAEVALDWTTSVDLERYAREIKRVDWEDGYSTGSSSCRSPVQRHWMWGWFVHVCSEFKLYALIRVWVCTCTSIYSIFVPAFLFLCRNSDSTFQSASIYFPPSVGMLLAR